MTTGTQVIFRENEQTQSVGTVSRVWDNGRYVTLISEGRTFVRDLRNVRVAR